MHPLNTAPRRPPDDVYHRLRQLVVTGRIAPGSRLVEVEVARHLFVSRTPAREALRRLVQEGLATVVGSGKRTQIAVAPATHADLCDLFVIVGTLEGVAGRGAEHLNRAARQALAGELSERNAAFARLSRARSRDLPRFFEAHDAFHALFVERCASERLQSLIGTVRPQVKRYELLYASLVGRDFTESLREHRRIIAAFRSGTPDAIEQSIRLNWFNSAKRLSRASASGGLAAIGDYRAGDRERH